MGKQRWRLTLKNRGQGDEGLGVSGGEGVGALGDWGGAGGGEAGGQEGDVGSLVGGHFHQVLVEWVWETGGDEVGVGVVGETFTVELVLQVLEGESVIEDVR